MNDPMNKFVIGKAQTELREFQSAGDAWAAAKAASATAPAKKPASTLVKTPSGNMIMDDKTAALKVVSDVSRKDPGLETRNLLDKLKDLLNEYLTTIPSGIQLWSEDKCHLPNMTSLSNCLYEATTEGFKPSLDLVAQVHRELEKNSRIFRNRHVVDAAGFYDGALHLQPGEAAPRVYQFVTEDEKLRAQAESFAAACTEARKLPDTELKKLATQDRKYPKRGQPGAEGGWR